MPVSSAIPMDRGDVTVEAIDLPQCSECGEPATHQVVLDLRECGVATIASSPMCIGDANTFADRLRGSLPAAEGGEH